MKTIALLLLCACSAWADVAVFEVPNNLPVIVPSEDEGPMTWHLSSVDGPNIGITAPRNSTNWMGHGDFSVKCFDKDGSVWVAKWKRQKSLAASLDATNYHWMTNYVGTNQVSVPALVGGHTNFIPATPDTAMKVQAMINVRGTNMSMEEPVCVVDVANGKVFLQFPNGAERVLTISGHTNSALPPSPLPGGHSNWIVASNSFTTNPVSPKFMSLRRSSVEPPIPPPGFDIYTNIIIGVVPPGFVLNEAAELIFIGDEPKKPRPHPNIPDHAEHPSKEKERVRIAAILSEKAKAVQSGILYPYEVKELNNFFDTPDDWTGWLIQRRGPQDNHWSECGKSAAEATRTSTVAGTAGYQYRLVRTAP